MSELVPYMARWRAGGKPSAIFMFAGVSGGI